MSTPQADDPSAALLARLRHAKGIDVDAGLAFLGHSTELYARLLNRFVALHEADSQQLQALAGEGDDERLHRLAHTIKGGAATLGLQAIAQSALNLEQALRDKAPREAVLESARGLIAGHAQLKDLLASGPSAAAPGSVDWTRAAACVQDLTGLLVDHDLRAVERFRGCEDVLAAALGDRVRQIRSQIDSFDFERALGSLRAAAGEEPRLRAAQSGPPGK
jgi:two-component system, sensor histidine kinase and response regulator